MRYLLVAVVCCVFISEIGCPPVNPNPQPVEGDSPDEDPGFGLEYDRYLREVVMALEEDETFRKKLEETNMTDIKSGKIAMHLDLVSHQVRERLDEIKRQEMSRLRNLAREKMQAMNGIQPTYPHHIDVKNPRSFEPKDLEKLIQKATNDLDIIDKKRKGEFKEYEMEKEHERQEELKKLDEEERKREEEKHEEMEKKHKDHPKVHHPGSKDQLEGVWEETDKMDPDDFDPKTFFKFHDIDGNGLLDQNEVEALFQKELDQVYDPNNPEDDPRERFEEMARMREHVFGELDHDKDRFISLEEFLTYTASQEFEKDEGWKTVDEEEIYTDDEYQKYEQMLREHDEKMRQQGLDPDSVQPGMVPVPHDPNVQQMQMPHGGQQQDMQQQQHLQQQQFQQQQHEQLQQQHHQQQQQQFQQQQHEQLQQQHHQQQQQQQQMGGVHQGLAGQAPGQLPAGAIPIRDGVPVQMPEGQMPGGQMPGGQMHGGQPIGGQMPGGQPIGGGPPGSAQNIQQGQAQNVQQGQAQNVQQGQGQPIRQQGQPVGGQQGQQPLKFESQDDMKRPMV